MLKPNQQISRLVWAFLIVLALIPVVVSITPRNIWGLWADKEITTTVEQDGTGTVIKSTETVRMRPGKTAWDWLSLLGVPLTLVLLGACLQYLQQKRVAQQTQLEKERETQRIHAEKAIAENNQKEEAIQAYFDRVSTLLIDKNLLGLASRAEALEKGEKELFEAALVIIRARTLSILNRLGDDGPRKGRVIQFLSEAEVISTLRLSLRGANLKSANLKGTNLINADLTDADLSSADLTDADLSYARLFKANLYDSHLSRANLSKAVLWIADLREADLSSAILHEAELIYANLENTKLRNTVLSHADLSMTTLSEEQVNSALFCKTTLPAEYSAESDRDCNKIEDPEAKGAKFIGERSGRTYW